jgi:hypothetical protein
MLTQPTDTVETVAVIETVDYSPYIKRNVIFKEIYCTIPSVLKTGDPVHIDYKNTTKNARFAP